MKIISSIVQCAGFVALSAAFWGIDWRAGLAVSGLSLVWVGVELERAA